MPPPVLIAVTLQGPGSRHEDIEVRGDLPAGELIPALLDVLGEDPASAPSWNLSVEDGSPVDRTVSLEQLNVLRGQVLRIVPANEEGLPPPPPAQGNRVTVGSAEGGRASESRGVIAVTKARLPQRVGVAKRVARAARAAFVREQPTSQASAQYRRVAEFALPERQWFWRSIATEWRETRYLHLLDKVVGARSLRNGVTIAVLSPKGGVGKTTITALLGTLLAHVRTERAVALDANPDFGSLGRVLVSDHGTYVDDFLEVGRRAPSITELDSHLGRGPHGLLVLPTPPDPARMRRFDPNACRLVMEKLRTFMGIVLVDCGTGVQHPVTRAVVEQADQLLLVSDTDVPAASLVAEAAPLVADYGKPMTLVVNKTGRGSRLDVEAFAAAIPEARALVTVSMRKAGAQALSSGRFAWPRAPRVWQKETRELAAVIVGDWERMGLLRPGERRPPGA